MSQPNRRGNRKKHHCYHYQHDNHSSRTNLLAPSSVLKPDSCASCRSNASLNYLPTETDSHSTPTTLASASLINNLVGKSTAPLAVESVIESSKASESCPLPKIESNAPKSSHPTTNRSNASSSYLPCNPASNVVPGHIQIKASLEKSDLRKSISTCSLPSKAACSSSPQRPDDVSFVKSDAKSNNPKSSLLTKTVPYSSPLKQWVVKSKASKSYLASKPIPVVSPTPEAASSPICSTKEIIISNFVPSVAKSNASETSLPSEVESISPRSSHPSKILSESSDSSLLCNPTPKIVPGCMQNKPPFGQSDVKLNISTSSFPSKDLSSSSPQSVDTVSFVQSDVKSNISTSSLAAETISSSIPLKQHVVPLPKKSVTLAPSMQWVVKSSTYNCSPPSNPTTATSFTPKAASPISSTKETITSTLPKAGPEQSKFGDAKLNASTKSSSSKAGPGPNEIKNPEKVGKGDTRRYGIPKRINKMLKNGIVPSVLEMQLSPKTYADYLAALLYAEDIYCEKWSEYLLKDVPIKLHIRENSKLQEQSNKKKSTNETDSKAQMNYPYVVFEIKEVPERRPFLLSRDHVHLKPSDENEDVEAFHGVLFRVKKSRTILAEFEEDFHEQHKPSKKYDVSFSFNRVCLKRAHHAVSAAANPLLCRILFPSPTSLPPQWDHVSPMSQILNHKLAPIPYLIEGPLSQKTNGDITNMLILIKDIILTIYESLNESRVLICAPRNRTCDALVRCLMEKVPEFDLFRANAAFRDKELVPDDIMPACLFQQERFTCPPWDELKDFRIITSTFVSTFRLYKAGLKAGHFSHIFLVDASSAIEPETIVALADLVCEETVVVVTGSVKDKPQWIRSDIGRNCGLRKSFFERLLKSKLYQSGNPHFITRIKAL